MNKLWCNYFVWLSWTVMLICIYVWLNAIWHCNDFSCLTTVIVSTLHWCSSQAFINDNYDYENGCTSTSNDNEWSSFNFILWNCWFIDFYENECVTKKKIKNKGIKCILTLQQVRLYDQLFAMSGGWLQRCPCEKDLHT